MGETGNFCVKFNAFLRAVDPNCYLARWKQLTFFPRNMGADHFLKIWAFMSHIADFSKKQTF